MEEKTIQGRVTSTYNTDPGIISRFVRFKQVDDQGSESKDAYGMAGFMPPLSVGQRFKAKGKWIERKAQNGKTYTNFDPKEVYPINTHTDMDFGSFEKLLRDFCKRNDVMRLRKSDIRQIWDEADGDPEAAFELASENAHVYFPERVADGVALSIRQNMDTASISTYLSSFGFDSRQMSNILEYYEYESEKIKMVIESNPYTLLANRIKNVGFKTVDRLALENGFDSESPDRIAFGYEHALKLAEEQGHCYLTKSQLRRTMLIDLGLNNRYADKFMEEKGIKNLSPADLIDNVKSGGEYAEDFKAFFAPYSSMLNQILMDRVERGHLIERIVRNYRKDGSEYTNKAYYLPYIYKKEKEIAEILSDMLTIETQVDESEARKRLLEITKADGVELTDEQFGAVINALSHKIYVVSGSAGTGKTLTVKYILRMFREMGISDSDGMINTAPTGKAADKAKTVSGIDGMTMHRLLGYRPDEGFTVDSLEYKVIICDETSMADIHLMHGFLKAVKQETHVVLVGDHCQLPSVGAGYVFGDIIASAYPVTVLSKVFRQADGSSLLNMCDDIRLGRKIEPTSPFSEGFSWEDKPQAVGCTLEELQENGSTPEGYLEELATNILPKIYGLDELQALSSKYKGMFGVDKLNDYMQKSLNPSRSKALDYKVKLSDVVSFDIRPKDRVIHTKNNPEIEVYNGEVGEVVSVKKEGKGEIWVKIGSGDSIRMVPYTYTFCKQLRLAYAITIHKSQGSEYQGVFLILTNSDKYMVDRSILYTAATRASDFLFILHEGPQEREDGTYSKGILDYAVKKMKAEKRNTNLKYMINKLL